METFPKNVSLVDVAPVLCDQKSATKLWVRRLKEWLKYCLWSAIWVNVTAAMPIGNAFSEAEAQVGPIFARVLILFLLLLLGGLIGTVVWGIKCLFSVKYANEIKDIPIGYIVGLFLAVVSLSIGGNLVTLILFCIYLVGRTIYRKTFTKSKAPDNN